MEDELRNWIESVAPTNAETIQMLQQLGGQFKYPKPINDGTQREFRGETSLPNDARYKGEWNVSENTKDGRGAQVWKDGSRYEGMWKNDMANGRGRLIHADGDIYEGEWLNDKAHGRGKYIHVDGAMYDGEWRDDK